MPEGKQVPADNLGLYKSWTTSFPLGSLIYKQKAVYTVMSAGTDFLILREEGNGTKVRIFRNTPESYEYSASPPVL